MAWYYVLDGASHGPVAEADLRDLRAQSVIALDTPVWTEGMAEWLPFSSSTLAVASSPVGTAVASTTTTVGATHTCVECGKLFSEEEMLHYEGSWVCAACKPMFFQRIKEGVAPKGAFLFASVWRRLGAMLIDVIIIDIVIFPLILLIGGFGGLMHQGLSTGVNALLYLIQYLLPASYEIFLIGTYGATFGKMLMKIKVVTAEGGKISYARSTGRYFAKMLSGIILCIGYLMAIWDEEKRALHDRLCKTRVITDEGT
jgi:uncharacterized RDD family membrane protein YckC